MNQTFKITKECSLNNFSVIDVIKETTHRIKNIDEVREKLSEQRVLNGSCSLLWSSLSISGGFPSLLLIFSCMEKMFPNEAWDISSHNCILKIKEEIEIHGIADLSLFCGLAGTCLSILHASRGKIRYSKIINSLQNFLEKEVEKKFIEPFRVKLRSSIPFRMEEYDLISGITGIGTYALQNRETSSMASLLTKILECAVSLSADIIFAGKKVPGWYLPPDFQSLDEEKKQFRKGSFNLGQAHGITGVLALLSVAAIHGVILPGQIEAIEKISSWIKFKRKEKHGLFFWAARISLEEEVGNAENVPVNFLSDSWCYGTPGISRSLYLASKALNDKSLMNFSEESFHSVFLRSDLNLQLSSPTFCHGISGLLMTTHHMAQDTGSIILKEWSNVLKKKLLSLYLPESKFGFRDIEKNERGEFVELDKIGLIDGLAGILLSLLTIEGGDSSWDAPFLIQAFGR